MIASQSACDDARLGYAIREARLSGGAVAGGNCRSARAGWTKAFPSSADLRVHCSATPGIGGAGGRPTAGVEHPSPWHVHGVSVQSCSVEDSRAPASGEALAPSRVRQCVVGADWCVIAMACMGTTLSCIAQVRTLSSTTLKTPDQKNSIAPAARYDSITRMAEIIPTPAPPASPSQSDACHGPSFQNALFRDRATRTVEARPRNVHANRRWSSVRTICGNPLAPAIDVAIVTGRPSRPSEDGRRARTAATSRFSFHSTVRMTSPQLGLPKLRTDKASSRFSIWSLPNVRALDEHARLLSGADGETAIDDKSL